MKATTGLTKQNCNVACLQNLKNPIVYVFPNFIEQKNKQKYYYMRILRIEYA